MVPCKTSLLACISWLRASLLELEASSLSEAMYKFELERSNISQALTVCALNS